MERGIVGDMEIDIIEIILEREGIYWCGEIDVDIEIKREIVIDKDIDIGR